MAALGECGDGDDAVVAAGRPYPHPIARGDLAEACHLDSGGIAIEGGDGSDLPGAGEVVAARAGLHRSSTGGAPLAIDACCDTATQFGAVGIAGWFPGLRVPVEGEFAAGARLYSDSDGIGI